MCSISLYFHQLEYPRYARRILCLSFILYTKFKINCDSWTRSAIQVLRSNHFFNICLFVQFPLPVAPKCFLLVFLLPSFKAPCWGSLLLRVLFHDGSLDCSIDSAMDVAEVLTTGSWCSYSWKGFLSEFVEFLSLLLKEFSRAVVRLPRS